MRQNVRRVVNICIVIMVAVAWTQMLMYGGENLAAGGFESLKFFTVQSNLLAGIAAAIWLICDRKGGSKAVERLKYVAAAAVALTMVTVLVFLGPLYGYPEMFAGPNLWMHLLVPLFAIAEVLFLTDTGYTRRDNELAVLPPLIYGVVYLANNIINGIGEWPDTNDWYLFLAWGYPIGIGIFAVICIVTWLMAFGMRKFVDWRTARKGSAN